MEKCLCNAKIKSALLVQEVGAIIETG